MEGILKKGKLLLEITIPVCQVKVVPNGQLKLINQKKHNAYEEQSDSLRSPLRSQRRPQKPRLRKNGKDL